MAAPSTVEANDRAAWRRWLSTHHRRQGGVWLVIHKKGSMASSLSYEDAVREALCFGWIDSTARRLDEQRYRLWMAPRKPKCVWSAANKRRLEDLIASGDMTEAGMAWIYSAKREQTRAKRVGETAALAARNERANRWRPKR